MPDKIETVFGDGKTVEARVPPHDLSAEAAVLSAAMNDRGAMAKASAIVRPEDFYSEAHRRTFEACATLFEQGKTVDIVTVATRLRDTDRIAQVGGMEYLTIVNNAAPALAGVEEYAEIVARKSRTRALILACQRVTAQGYAGVGDEDAFLDHAESAIHEIACSRRRTTVDTMRAALHRAFTKIGEAAKRTLNERYSGTPTGFVDLDNEMGGLQEGEQTVVAARPGMGKTALAMNVASHFNARKIGVVAFSLEMPNEQIAMRALCSHARVDVRKARVGQFNREEMSKLAIAAGELATFEHYYLIETPCSLLDVRSIVRARQADMQRAGVKLGLVIVDYAQLMDGREGVRSREEAVAENARGLKLLSKEAKTHVMLLSQLNRGVESRPDKRPMLADLRESGAIEEAADAVIGLYRDDYYNKESKEPGVVELLLLKHRHGPTGTVKLGFHAQSTTFYNLEEPREDWHG